MSNPKRCPSARSRQVIGKLRSTRTNLWGREGGGNTIENFIKDLERCEPLPASEQIALARRAIAGDVQARQRLIQSNLRIIVRIAHEFAGLGLSALDLIDEGVIGMDKAVDRFDPERGPHFLTYAVWYVKQQIQRALLRQSGVITIPYKEHERRRIVARQLDTLRKKFGTNGDAETQQEIQRLADLGGLDIRPAKYVPLYVPENSVDVTSGEERFATPVPEISSEDLDEAKYVCMRQYRQMILRLAEMRQFSVMDKQLFFEYFGFNGSSRKSFAEIGKEHGFSKQRAEQRISRVIERFFLHQPSTVAADWLNRLSQAYQAHRELVEEQQQYGLET